MHIHSQVNVMRAKDLPTADVVGSSDAFVELTTDGKHTVSTRVIPDSLEPVCARVWLLFGLLICSISCPNILLSEIGHYYVDP